MTNVLSLNGQFQKISIPIQRMAFWNSEGKGGGGFFELEFRRNGGSLKWNSEGMGKFQIWEFQRGRQDCVP